MSDSTCPPQLRGKYLAFSPAAVLAAAPETTSEASSQLPPTLQLNSATPTAGLAHLKYMQQAGITHVHLLPIYDFGSVPERDSEQLQPELPARVEHRQQQGRLRNPPSR